SYLHSAARFGDFMYSNTGILTLGKVIEAVSGLSWDQFVATRLLQPAGMNSTNTREDSYIAPGSVAQCWLCTPKPGAKIGLSALQSPQIDAAVPHGLVQPGTARPGTGRKVEVWPWRYEPSITPAGAVNSSAHDLARWMILHLNRGVIDGKQ